jgi:F-type H+-transporting ATPase subunit alpha
VALWLGTSGRLDRVPTEDVARFESELLDYLRRQHDGVLGTIRETLKFEDDTEKSLIDAYDSFLDQFETSEGGSIHVGDQVHEEAMEDDELEQEQIVKQKRS